MIIEVRMLITFGQLASVVLVIYYFLIWVVKIHRAINLGQVLFPICIYTLISKTLLLKIERALVLELENLMLPPSPSVILEMCLFNFLALSFHICKRKLDELYGPFQYIDSEIQFRGHRLYSSCLAVICQSLKKKKNLHDI